MAFTKEELTKTYTTIGASNHSDKERVENDYYATSPLAVKELLDRETFNKKIWECAVGGGHISKVLEAAGYEVFKSDIIQRIPDTEIIDFLNLPDSYIWDGDIITNPPYTQCQPFVEKALSVVKPGAKVVMYLKLTFLEGIARQKLFQKNPPKYVYVAAKRMGCGRNGVFQDQKNEYEAGAIAFAWYVWEKGFTGEPTIRWFNTKN